MKALQDKGVAKEGVITRLHKCIKNMTDRQKQYKEALRTLNQEVKELREKLEEEDRQKKKDQEAKETVEKELAALLSQVETAKADTVKEFRASQTFVDSCAEYYGVGFEDCLKQVKSIYLYLDLSKVSMDDLVPSTQAGDTTLEENDDFTDSEANLEDDNVILAQPVADKPVVPLIPLANTSNAEDPPTQEAKNLPFKATRSHKTPRPLEPCLCSFFIVISI